MRTVMQLCNKVAMHGAYGDNYNEFALFCRVRIDAHQVKCF